MVLVRQVALPKVPVRQVARPEGAGSAGCSSRRCLALRCEAASQWCHIGFRGAATSSAQTSASLHPPAALRLRVLPFTRDMGVHGLCGRVPDSAGSIICHLAAAPQARRQPYPAQVRQIASQTGVLPRRMRFVAGRGHCSSKSPRGRILVLGPSGAHWPARWPRFELTERVVKSQLSGY